MKVYNLTDVKTDRLYGAGLLGATLKVGKHAVKPGEHIEISHREFEMADVGRLVNLGALCKDRVPAAYAKAKAKPAPKPTPTVSAVAPPPPKAAEPRPKKSEGTKKE